MATKPRVILGLMVQGPGGRMTELDDVKKSLDMFQERGYTELDTARSYLGGKQEPFTREAGWKERGLSIATKVFPLVPGAHKAEALTSEAEISLRELGADCIDVCEPRSPTPSWKYTDNPSQIFYLHAVVSSHV